MVVLGGEEAEVPWLFIYLIFGFVGSFTAAQGVFFVAMILRPKWPRWLRYPKYISEQTTWWLKMILRLGLGVIVIAPFPTILMAVYKTNPQLDADLRSLYNGRKFHKPEEPLLEFGSETYLLVACVAYKVVNKISEKFFEYTPSSLLTWRDGDEKDRRQLFAWVPLLLSGASLMMKVYHLSGLDLSGRKYIENSLSVPHKGSHAKNTFLKILGDFAYKNTIPPMTTYTGREIFLSMLLTATWAFYKSNGPREIWDPFRKCFTPRRQLLQEVTHEYRFLMDRDADKIGWWQSSGVHSSKTVAKVCDGLRDSPENFTLVEKEKFMERYPNFNMAKYLLRKTKFSGATLPAKSFPLRSTLWEQLLGLSLSWLIVGFGVISALVFGFEVLQEVSFQNRVA